MADWNNETDSIVIGKCFNANSDPSGVNGTKQGNNGKAISTTSFRIGLGEGGSESWSTNHCDESIVEHSVLATQDIESNIKPFLNIVLNFDQFHPILDSDINENYDHAKIDVWQKCTHHRTMLNCIITMIVLSYFKFGKSLLHDHNYMIHWSYFWSKNYHICKHPVPLSIGYPWSYIHDSFYLQTKIFKSIISSWSRWSCCGLINPIPQAAVQTHMQVLVVPPSSI